MSDKTAYEYKINDDFIRCSHCKNTYFLKALQC